jgi:hypothetical protein
MSRLIRFVPSALLLLTATGAAGQALGVESNLPSEGFVDRHSSIELRFSQPLEDERIAVVLGTADLSDLFVRGARSMRYTPELMPLPSGEHELVAYRVGSDGSWSEVFRSPVRVRNRAGFDQTRFEPGGALGVAGPLGSGQDPPQAPPGTGFQQDLSVQLKADGELVRDGSRITGTTTIAGNSERKSALRFGERGSDAPKIDLSSYQLRFSREQWNMELGHVAHGNQRHLINSFDSRGTTLSLLPSSRLTAVAAVMNGSRIVGWDNPLGLNQPNHRILSGSVGLEVLPRNGALRVEFTGLDGSVLPTQNFNQGSVVDAEMSRGMGMRLQASTPARRLTLDAGIAQSSFTNPIDPTVAQGDELVPVKRETRTARFLETSVGVLQALSLGGTRRADLTLGYRHEQVDPLYRSVGAYTRSDVLQNTGELRGNVAGWGMRISWNGSENNLDRIPSILTTRTRRRTFDTSLPLAQFLGVRSRAAPWLPALRYAVDHTHQFGLGVPAEGGFDESHVPDQVSVNRSGTIDWRWTRVNLALRFDRRHQDNRQAGREAADFTTGSNTVALGLPMHSRVSANLSIGRERAERHETGQTDRTVRYGAGFNWSPLQRATLSLDLTNTRADYDLGLREQENLQVDARWSAAVPRLSALGGTYFLRYARASASSFERQTDLSQQRQDWSVSSGLNFTF